MQTQAFLKEKLIVGITGGIGSGKTSATNIFAQLGINIIDTDVLARAALTQGSPLLSEVFNYFGEGFKRSDGSLNRAALREEIFNSSASKAWLEALIHPWVKEQTKKRLIDASSTSPYVILVSPLLIEAGQLELINRLLIVDINPDEQLERTALRDNTSREQVAKIMQQQLDRSKRLSLADDILDNSKDLIHLEKQVRDLHDKYLHLAAAKDK